MVYNWYWHHCFYIVFWWRLPNKSSYTFIGHGNRLLCIKKACSFEWSLVQYSQTDHGIQSATTRKKVLGILGQHNWELSTMSLKGPLQGSVFLCKHELALCPLTVKLRANPCFQKPPIPLPFSPLHGKQLSPMSYSRGSSSVSANANRNGCSFSASSRIGSNG